VGEEGWGESEADRGVWWKSGMPLVCVKEARRCLGRYIDPDSRGKDILKRGSRLCLLFDASHTIRQPQ
jgi:hypothetical protein